METTEKKEMNESRTYQVGAVTIAAGRKIQTEIEIGEDEIYITNYLNTKVNPAR